jgi:26S proteasome regulatory subunit N1
MTAIAGLKKEIRSSTSSMTAVPKPLKFLRCHFEPLKEHYASMSTSETKEHLADVLSVLAMTFGSESEVESLRFRLVGSGEALGLFGHEYIRHLAGEIGRDWQDRVSNDKLTSDLLILVKEIVPFNIEHHDESGACDLLMEVDQLTMIKEHINKDNYSRICKYLTACSDYAPDVEDQRDILDIVYSCYRKMDDLPSALRIAVRVNDRSRMVDIIKTSQEDGDETVTNQLCFILGSLRIVLEDFEDEDEIMELMGNANLSEHFLNLATELDVKEPKLPEDIYKSHLVDGAPSKRDSSQRVDSAKENLADTFVNAFVNVGYGNDKLVTPDGSDWMYKNREHGMMSAAASLGMVMLWDLDVGYSTIDQYTISQQDYIKAGAVLATGMISTGVTSEMDCALALLPEHLESDSKHTQIAAILGLAFAYCGNQREEVMEYLVPIIVDADKSMEVASMTALALGMVFAGSGNLELSMTIMEALMERSDTDLSDSSAKFMCLGLGLLFLGLGEGAELTIEATVAVEHPISDYLKLTIETCAWAGTGSVLAIQRLLKCVGKHPDADADADANADANKNDDENSDSKDNSTANAAASAGDHDDEAIAKKNVHQDVATLGLALVSIGEPLAQQMGLRSLDHVLQYGEVNCRRAAALALGFLSISNPELTVMDTLSKLAHDHDERVSQNAVFALGMLGAGTNNSRIANTLRQLSAYYAKEPNHLFLVRIAQGMLHLGKGLMTLSPVQSDRSLLSNTSLAGLLVVLHSALDMQHNILGDRHYLLYSLISAVRPRMLLTVDEKLQSLPVKVRVGQAVDTVGQAGKPRSITGFQTQTTPVLLAENERAELATEEYVAQSNVLEGFVIVTKNPDYVSEEEQES